MNAHLHSAALVTAVLGTRDGLLKAVAYGGRYGLKVRGLKYLYCYGNDTTSRKIERVKNQPFKSRPKISEIFQKHKTPYFSLPGGAGTKKTIIWDKLQVHGYLEAWLLVSIRVYKLKKSIYSVDSVMEIS